MKKLNAKKLAAYAAMGILGISVVLYTGFYSDLQEESDQNIRSQKAGSVSEQLCRESDARSNHYVKEFKIPTECSLPVGITADNEGRVWFASTRTGSIVMFNPQTNDYQEFEIPSWPLGSEASGGSQVWRLRFDVEGNLWFTDEKQNSLWRFFPSSGRFERYLVPSQTDKFSTTYPVDIDFDRSGNPYFVGIRSKELWIMDKSLLEDGTSNGISGISMPIGGFQGIDSALASVGSLVVDRNRNEVWISLLAFNIKGQLLRYDIDSKEFLEYDLPENLKSPLGLSLDKNGDLWVTNHGTSIFFKLNTTSGQITQYVTSPISNRVFGGKEVDAYTLPYWIASDSDGSIWFNEHIGNKIARFDPQKETLIEYWIPTQNPKYSQCTDIEAEMECGIANALQFTVDSRGNAWFSEWTENKIGTVSVDKPVPVYVEAPDETLTIKRGESKSVTVNVGSFEKLDAEVNLVVAGTLTSTGNLGNTTAIFSQDELFFNSQLSKEITLTVTAGQDSRVGKYTLMVGAEYGDITVSKAVRMNLIS